jgi:hypothetical protein
VLYVTVATTAKPIAEIPFGSLIPTGYKLARSQDLTDLLIARQFSPSLLIPSMVWLVFSAAVVGSLLHVKDFRRGDDDLVWLARQQLVLGNFSNAAQQLSSVDENTADSCLIAALLGVNDVDGAMAAARRLTGYKKYGDTSPRGVFGSAMMPAIVYPVPIHVTVEVLVRAAKTDIADHTLGGVSSAWLMQRNVSAVAVKPLVAALGEGGR